MGIVFHGEGLAGLSQKRRLAARRSLRLSFCQNVKRAARASHISGQKDRRRQIRGSRALEPWQLASHKAAFAWQMYVARETRALEKAGRVSHRPFRLSFCFFRERALCAPNRKICGVKRAGIPPFGWEFSEKRREIRQYADIRVAQCGEEKCLLRKAACALADSKRRFCGIFG